MNTSLCELTSLIEIFCRINVNSQQCAATTANKHDYVGRIIGLLNMQQNMISNANLYDLICSQYPNHNVTHFITDYHQFVANLDSDRLYLKKQNDNACSVQDCIHLKRYYRNRNENDENTQKV